MNNKKHKNILTATEAIAKYCPNARTLKEIFKDNPKQLKEVCQNLNCSPNEIMLNKDEIITLINFAPLSASDKNKLSKYIF